MPQKDLIIHIGANTIKLQRELGKAQTRVAAFGAAIVVSGGAVLTAINEFSKYETALIGVGKTTGIVGDELKEYGKQIKALSIETGQSTNDLLAISQAAGQLGVTGSERLQKFTKTIAMLGTASDLAGEEAATTLTRILNVTGEGVDQIDTFASVIVRLGNNFAASESEIARMAQETSKATAVFGVSSSQAAALGTAMKSVGVQAELGGSVIGKSFRTIDAAIRNGGKELEALQIITGMTGDELKQTFETDATLVFQKFVEGLGDVKKGGGSVADTLEIFGLKGDEVNKVLPVLAERSELLGAALNQAADEIKNTTALEAEFAVQSDTVEVNLSKLQNAVINLATGFGETLAPTVSFAAKVMTEDIEGFGKGMAAVGDIFSGIATIIGESLNFLIGKFDEFAASSLRSIAATIEQAQNLADVLPFVEGSFQGSIDGINAKADEYEQAAKERTKRSTEFFVSSEQEKINALVEGLDSRTVAEEENHELKTEIDEERRATEIEKSQEHRDEDIETEDERNEEDILRKIQQLKALNVVEEEQSKEAKKRKKDAEKSLTKSKKDRVKEEKKLDQVLVDSSMGALSTIVGDNKAAQAAIFLVQKAMAISKILITTEQAAALAFSSQLIPGDPTSLARAAAAAAATQAQGAAQIGIVAASALPELAATFAAHDGGKVPGAAMGDKPFGYLEGGEGIIPTRLMPTFETMFPTFPESPDDVAPAQDGGEVQIMIGLTDDASQILTVNQYEDSRIGVSR